MGPNKSFGNVEADQLGSVGSPSAAFTHDAVEQGYLVGSAVGAEPTIIDPADYNSDAEAMQAANDGIVASIDAGDNIGVVYIPARKPNGNEWTIDETVVFGSTSADYQVVPRGWGFTGQDGPVINCTINDGTPMFDVQSNASAGGRATLQAQPFGYFVVDGSQNDFEAIRLRNCVGFRLEYVHTIDIDTTTAEGIFVIDGACFNSTVDNTSYSGLSPCPDADVWVLVDPRGDGPPGEIKFKSGNSTFANQTNAFNSGLRSEINSTGIRFDGRIEGAGGDGLVYITGGHLMIDAELDNVFGTNTDMIYFDGTKMSVKSLNQKTPNTTGGHVIHIPNAPNQVRISESINTLTGNTGDVIHLPNGGGGSARYVVPREETVTGSVTYPSVPWEATRYTAGYQPYREGTASVTAGTTADVENFAGNAQEEKFAHVWDNQDVDAETRIAYGFGSRGSGAGHEKLWVEEKQGNADAEIQYVVYRYVD